MAMQTPNLDAFISGSPLQALIAQARLEDLGPDCLDVTSAALIPPTQTCTAQLTARQAGTLAGASMLPAIAAAFDPGIEVEALRDDGSSLSRGDVVARFRGPLASVLSMERVALNFLTHLCGIATLAAQYVDHTRGTRAKIYDTRKTLPGLRALEKYAVACGGGATHRIGLYDAMLVKDNHIAHLPLEQLAGALSAAIAKARRDYPHLKFVEVEVDSLAQLEHVLQTPVDIVLLDNMTIEQLDAAVAMRDRIAPQVELEASGGVSLETVAVIARTGVDRISVGALTHSAPSLDLGLDIR
jgi:nicotinate-nucleotide pyrophosphorylase (carboxylating)